MSVVNRAARTGAPRDPEGGFTLIELLVVVIIIGILAAIAIPVYIGVQNSAKDSSTKSDLVNAKSAVAGYYSNANGWGKISSTGSVNAASSPASGFGGFGNYGWTGTTAVDDSLTAGGSQTSWCIQQTSASGTVWYIDTVDSPTKTKPTTYCQ